MGKIVKFCNACEEGFAEKFGFCPNCGAHLTAFEMNPLDKKPAAEPKNEPVKTVEATAPTIIETAAKESPKVAETQSFSAETTPETKDSFEFSDDVFDEPVKETKTFVAPKIEETKAFVAPKVAATEAFTENLHQATYDKAENEAPKTSAPYYVADLGFQPTIVREKNVKQRNTLLLGAFLLATTLMVGGYVYSMFNKFLDIAAIDSGSLLAYVGEVDPTEMEMEEPPKKNKDDGGGGGGGGKNEPTPATKGRLATQTPDPIMSPDANADKVTNPALTIPVSTKGNRQQKPTDENYGLPTGLDGRSNGTGNGGGLGNGNGRGQGNGNGNGLGNGNGDGSGNGNGNGNGNGTGGGDGIEPTFAKKSPVPIGPTESVKILSKPRANYTDAARQNQVQGKVVLRVTFSANGSIGAISVISGLGNGLTEQAIAAARGIKFEPAKRGGVPYAVTKPVEYSFTIY